MRHLISLYTASSALICLVVFAQTPASLTPGPAGGYTPNTTQPVWQNGPVNLYRPHASRCSPSVTVSWDALPEVDSYDVQVRRDGVWTDWKTKTTETYGTLPVKPGEKLAFRLRVHGKGYSDTYSPPVLSTVGGDTTEVYSPAEGDHFLKFEEIVLLSNAAGDDCDIVSITWLLDGRAVGTSKVAPYRTVLPAPVLGRHEIKAIAAMTDGSSRPSRPVHFQVDRDLPENLPEAVSGLVRWLYPAPGATVRGKVRLLTSAPGRCQLERLDVERLRGVIEGSSPHPLVTLPSAFELPMDRHILQSTARTPEDLRRIEKEVKFLESINPRELPFDFSKVASGTYRVTASGPDGPGEARIFQVESSLKPPAISFDERKGIRVGYPDSVVSGYVREGTLPVGEILISHQGIVIGRAEPLAPSRGAMSWRGVVMDLPPTGPISLTAVALDTMGNRSIPARITDNKPLRIGARCVLGEEGARVGKAIQVVASEAWPIDPGLRYRYEVSSTGGKSWKVLRAFAPQSDAMWTPKTPGRYLIRVTARKGQDTAACTIGPITVRY